MAEEKKTIVEKLHAISTPAEENWLEIADKWEEEDKVLEELIKYFQGLWPGMKTAEQCNTDMHFTPPAIMRLAKHFYELGKQSKEPVSEDLEKAAREYNKYSCNKAIREGVFPECPPIYIIDAFIAGAEWQAERLLKGSPMPEDTVLFNKGIEEGKRLMMEDAVEGEIVQDVYSRELRCKTKDLRKGGFKFGDKVKIIIVKED